MVDWSQLPQLKSLTIKTAESLNFALPPFLETLILDGCTGRLDLQDQKQLRRLKIWNESQLREFLQIYQLWTQVERELKRHLKTWTQ